MKVIRVTSTMPLDLAVGQVVHVDGVKYRVHGPPLARRNGSVWVEVYSEDD